MLRFLAVLVFIMGGYGYQAHAQLSVSVEGSSGRGNCSYEDGSVTIAVNDSSRTSGNVALTIKCAPNANDTKTSRYTGSVTLNNNGKADSDVVLADHNMAKGDHCTVTASIDSDTPTAEFTVGYKQIGGAPPRKIVGGEGITAGQEFAVENLHVFSDPGIPFFDVLLRECTASTDPWIFWTHGSVLERVYPTSSINANNNVAVVDGDSDSSDNECLGMYDGQMQRLFTLGTDHSGCKLKLVKEDVMMDGGNQPSIVTFTEMGAPALAAEAAVTTSNGKVMVHTGAKPTIPAGIVDGIEVYVSTNRGVTWAKSTLVDWTGQATDSGVAAADSTDNTRNLAVLKITDDTNVWWWRIIKGQ